MSSIHRAHDVLALVGQPHHGVEAVENFAVVDSNLEPLQTQLREGTVDDGGDFRFVDDVQLAIADDVDVCLIELPEPASLCSFASIDLADLIAAEWELQFAVVERHILGQGNGQVKAECQVAVTLLEAVDLFLCLSAAFGQ